MHSVNELRKLIAEGLRTQIVAGRSWSGTLRGHGSPNDADLLEVAAATGLSREDVVAIHSSAEYQVCFVAFVPGLPVLGGLPPALHLPRRPDPRPGIQAGCVADRRHARSYRANNDAEWLVHSRPDTVALLQRRRCGPISVPASAIAFASVRSPRARPTH